MPWQPELRSEDMSLGERIRERLRVTKTTQAALAAAINVSPQAVSKLVTGETTETSRLYQIARFLHTSPEYLLGETDDPNPVALQIDHTALDARAAKMLEEELAADTVQLREIDLQYGMGATYLDVPVTTELRTFSREWLRGFTKAPPEMLFWATGDGDSMEPTIRAGETFLIDASQRTPRMSDGIWALAIGEIGMVKRLSFQGGGFIELHSDNPLVRPMPVSEDELHVIGRVIAVVRRL